MPAGSGGERICDAGQVFPEAFNSSQQIDLT
jgi:hypothetical protein